MTLATQLSAFPDITTRIIDHKLGPLTFGQADQHTAHVLSLGAREGLSAFFANFMLDVA